MQRLIPLLWVLVLSAHGTTARAESAGAGDALPTLRDFSSVRAVGMAGAARGNAPGNEALLLNPAAMAAVPRLNFAASLSYIAAYGTRFWGFDSVDSASLLGGVEGGGAAGGFGYYRYASGKGTERREGTLSALGGAIPFTDSLCLGFTAKYLKLSGAVRSEAVTADVAVLLRLGAHLSVSGIGYNLIDVRSDEAQRAFAVAAGFTIKDFLADFDVRLEKDGAGNSVQTYAMGVEHLFWRRVAPRVGFAFDGLRDVRQLGLGASLVFESFVLEGAYRKDFGGEGHEFSIALRAWKL